MNNTFIIKLQLWIFLSEKNIESLYIFSVSWSFCKWWEGLWWSLKYIFLRIDLCIFSISMVGCATLTWIACVKVDKINVLEHFSSPCSDFQSEFRRPVSCYYSSSDPKLNFANFILYHFLSTSLCFDLLSREDVTMLPLPGYILSKCLIDSFR